MSHRTARALVAFLLTATCACEVSSGGMGIGLPDVVGRQAVARLPVAFTRAHLPDGPAAAGARFIELVNTGDAPLDLTPAGTPLTLVGAGGTVPLPAQGWAAGATLRVGGAQLAPLGLHRHLGEVALLDANANLQAYAAWGGDGVALPGGLGEMARQRGLATVGASPLAYPLADDQAVLLTAADGGACTTADVNAAPPFAAAACTAKAGVAPLQLVRAVVAGIADDGASFELYNPDATNSLDPYGLWVCTGSAGCRRLTYATPNGNGPIALAPAPAGGLASDPIQASSRQQVVTGGAAAQSAATNALRTTLPPLHATDELCLLPPQADPNGSATDALDYLRLALDRAAPLASPNALLARVADPALRAAWSAEAAPAPRLANEAVVRVLDAPAGTSAPASWRLTAKNQPISDAGSSTSMPPLARTADAYTACSAPLRPTPVAVQLADVVVLAPDEFRLVLRRPAATAGSDAPLEGLEVMVGGLTFDVPTPLAAGAELWLGVTARPACAAAHDACWSGSTASLSAGEVTVRRADQLLAHVQWGEGTLASSRGTAAASAGLWPAPSCREPSFTGLDVGTNLQLAVGRPGQSPADYLVGN